MGLYLAYAIREEDFSEKQLERIMTDWFDFPKDKRVHDFNSWLESARRQLNRFKQCGNLEIVQKHLNDDKTQLRLAASYDPCQYVAGWPTLEISFRYQDICPHCPSNFTGLSVWPGHSGSEGVVDMIKFKPEMDRYLALQKIIHKDLSFIEL